MADRVTLTHVKLDRDEDAASRFIAAHSFVELQCFQRQTAHCRSSLGGGVGAASLQEAGSLIILDLFVLILEEPESETCWKTRLTTWNYVFFYMNKFELYSEF